MRMFVDYFLLLLRLKPVGLIVRKLVSEFDIFHGYCICLSGAVPKVRPDGLSALGAGWCWPRYSPGYKPPRSGHGTYPGVVQRRAYFARDNLL